MLQTRLIWLIAKNTLKMLLIINGLKMLTDFSKVFDAKNKAK